MAPPRQRAAKQRWAVAARPSRSSRNDSACGKRADIRQAALPVAERARPRTLGRRGVLAAHRSPLPGQLSSCTAGRPLLNSPLQAFPSRQGRAEGPRTTRPVALHARQPIRTVRAAWRPRVHGGQVVHHDRHVRLRCASRNFLPAAISPRCRSRCCRSRGRRTPRPASPAACRAGPPVAMRPSGWRFRYRISAWLKVLIVSAPIGAVTCPQGVALTSVGRSGGRGGTRAHRGAGGWWVAQDSG